MTISNKIAMDIAIDNMGATAIACPAWVYIILGVVALILVSSIIAIFTVNK